MNTLDALAAASQAAADASAAARSEQKLASDFDAFLELLTAQLRNQDPLDPMDAKEFTNQLVQFSGVEQQIQTNSNLESLITSTAAQSVNAAVSYIGSTVRAEGSTTSLTNSSATWDVAAAALAPESIVTIFDQYGNEVYKTEHAFSAGESKYVWDGMTNDGSIAPDGQYRIGIQGRDANGDAVRIGTAIEGKVTGVDFTSSTPVVLLGDTRVSLSSIMQVNASDS